MKLLKGRVMTYIALTVVALSLIGMIAAIVVVSMREPLVSYNTESYKPHKVFVNGKYSIDGGEWQDTLPNEMLHSRFHTVTIKGELSMPAYNDQQLVIFAENIWYELKTGDVSLVNESNKQAPGCTISSVPVIYLSSDPEHIPVTLTLNYPYTAFSNADLSDFFQIYLTDASGVYEIMLQNVLLSVIFCVVICFFGLIAFPIAGTVLGGINMRYLAFSVLCFFTGLHLLMQVMYPYLPLWLDDSVLCMSLCETTSHLFGLCAFIFIKVILEDTRHKIIGNITLLSFSALVISLYVLSATGVCDLYASNPYAQLFFSVCAIVLTVCLFREMGINRDARSAAFTLIPLAVALTFDTVNMYLGLTDFMLFEFGVAVTLIYQVVNLILDLRKQYKETLRYQQLQKELYESRVAIMVSQIQPHFLYNSLTSIAMMCSIDPDTAQEATITFADYLRGNMDSLKQKTPVPFARELEHLKKYLYIEKLRFGDDLNIAYDIQTDAFVLPQLSIQPLVENAVKHGVGMKREGGTVTIATRETENAFKVIISDDGVGFDTEQVKNDGRSHIGMDNVRRRLAEMCGGTVTITSEIGKGTIATVSLPKEGQSNENLMR